LTGARRGTARPAGPGSLRPPEPSARLSPGAGVRLPAAAGARWARPRRARTPGRRAAGRGEEVYRLFDRRCRTETAVATLAKLRSRVHRFKQVGKILNKLRSPPLEQALTFLDDNLLLSTSNAVERRIRHHRKMQKDELSARVGKPDFNFLSAPDPPRPTLPAPARSQAHRALAA
jgi:hypothetical protein